MHNSFFYNEGEVSPSRPLRWPLPTQTGDTPVTPPKYNFLKLSQKILQIAFRGNLLLFLLSVLIVTGCTKKSRNQQIPQRVVCLSPASAEVIYALEKWTLVVAVSEYTDYPEAAKDLPKAGGFDGREISAETLLSFNPDFVYLTKGMHDFLKPVLDQFGISYYESSGQSVEDVLEEIKAVGKIFNAEKKAAEVTRQIQQKIDSAKEINDNKKLKVYWEVWNEPYMSAGKNSFINSLINLAGGMNIFEQMEVPYSVVSEEAIMAAEPDVILIPESSNVKSEDVKKRSGWRKIPAVKNEKVFVINDSLLCRPGPRIGDCVLELGKLFDEVTDEK